MHLLKKKSIEAYQARFPEASSSLSDWLGIVKAASWGSYSDIVTHATQFKPSPLPTSGRVVFNIKGNKFRLICAVDFTGQALFVKWFGTHAEYDKIDAHTASNF